MAKITSKRFWVVFKEAYLQEFRTRMEIRVISLTWQILSAIERGEWFKVRIALADIAGLMLLTGNLNGWWRLVRLSGAQDLSKDTISQAFNA